MCAGGVAGACVIVLAARAICVRLLEGRGLSNVDCQHSIRIRCARASGGGTGCGVGREEQMYMYLIDRHAGGIVLIIALRVDQLRRQRVTPSIAWAGRRGGRR